MTVYHREIQKLIIKLTREKVTVLRLNGDSFDTIVTPNLAERLVTKSERVFEVNGKLTVQMPTAYYTFHNTDLVKA